MSARASISRLIAARVTTREPLDSAATRLNDGFEVASLSFLRTLVMAATGLRRGRDYDRCEHQDDQSHRSISPGVTVPLGPNCS